jgi:Zn-dependent metalloprotease
MKATRKLSLWTTSFSLLSAVGWMLAQAPASEVPLPAFRLHPLAQASATALPAATNTNDPAAPNATPVDPRVSELARWLRAQLAARPAGLTNAAGNPGQPAAAVAETERRAALARLQTRCGNDVQILWRPAAGTPLLIKGRLLEPRFSGIAKAGLEVDELTARSFLRTNRALLRLEDPDRELGLARRERDDLGYRHLRFTQVYQELPVWPCELIVHLHPDGHVVLMDGAFVPTPTGVETTPRLTGAEAAQRARASVPGGEEAELIGPELVIFAPLDQPPRLAWKMELGVSLAAHWRCVVDAADGTLLEQLNLVQEAGVSGSGQDSLGNLRPLQVWQEGATFFMVDTSKRMFDPSSVPPNDPRGAIVILDARNQPPTDDQEVVWASLRELQPVHVTSVSANAGWVPDAVGAAFGLSQTYDYYLARHNRNSLGGNGENIVGVVRLGRDMFNAFWAGHLRMMFFGDRFTRAVDVCGHELTHGVINSLGNGGILEYENQSGALNEAFADIFGEMVEAYAKGGRPDWLKGKELFVMQNYANPAAVEIVPGRRYPAKMSELVPPTDPIAARDAGGVHLNSSIINHCFYLLAEGLEGAIGLRDAERIFYRALTVHLQKQSQFIDARLACVNAAETLFGATSPQARKTREAFDRVEIFETPGTPTPPPIPTVEAADSTLALRLDPVAGQYYLVRREAARGDAAGGQFLNTLKYLAPRRVAVTGNGATAFYVTSDHDLGIVETDGSNPRTLDKPGLVHSLAVAPNGSRFAFVLLDEFGQPINEVVLVDLNTETERNIRLYAPGTEGARADIIRFADAMTFTADGQTLIYDAYAELRAEGGQTFSGWTLYALELATDTIRALVDLNAGLDFGNPSLGRVRNHLLTFEVINKTNGVSTLIAADLATGKFNALGTINPAHSIGVPGYTGDDRAIVYAQGDGNAVSGFSLLRQPLAEDGVTPSGAPTLWMADADIGVIYRRGQFVPSNAPPTVRLTSPAPGQQFTAPASIALQATASDPDGRVARVEFYNGSTRLGEDTTAPYSFTWSNVPAGAYRLLARAVDDLGAAADSEAVEVLAGGGEPDLVCPNIDLMPQPAIEGQTVTLTARIRNAGAGPAPATRARAFLSPADDFNTSDDFAFPQTLSVPGLNAGQEVEVSWQAPMPDLGSGNYSFWALVRVDSDNTVDEADEANLFKRTNPLTAQDPSGQPPTITTHPQSQTVTAGANVTFTVVATGTPPLSYQWRKDGQDLAGATAASLVLNNVQTSHAGTYTVRVSNSAGAVTSNPATLTVSPAQAPRHPADVNPPDNRLTLQEMIAYAAAYKRTQPWPEGPNPIPLDYMIRAATLYKRGETYRHDPAAGGPPLWWVNSPAP